MKKREIQKELKRESRKKGRQQNGFLLSLSQGTAAAMAKQPIPASQHWDCSISLDNHLQLFQVPNDLHFQSKGSMCPKVATVAKACTYFQTLISRVSYKEGGGGRGGGGGGGAIPGKKYK